MVSHSGLITVMQKAARKAAPRIRRDFNEVEQLQVSRKGPADFVSMADKQAEQTIVEELRRARPDWGLMLEEGGTVEGDPDKPRFIVDPIDGTANFLHGMPHFSHLDRGGRSRVAPAGGRKSPRPSSTSRSPTRASGRKRAGAPGSTSGACASRRAATSTKR
jgi:hypothetical protein